METVRCKLPRLRPIPSPPKVSSSAGGALGSCLTQVEGVGVGVGCVCIRSLQVRVRPKVGKLLG